MRALQVIWQSFSLQLQLPSDSFSQQEQQEITGICCNDVPEP